MIRCSQKDGTQGGWSGWRNSRGEGNARHGYGNAQEREKWGDAEEELHFCTLCEIG